MARQFQVDGTEHLGSCRVVEMAPRGQEGVKHRAGHYARRAPRYRNGAELLQGHREARRVQSGKEVHRKPKGRGTVRKLSSGWEAPRSQVFLHKGRFPAGQEEASSNQNRKYTFRENDTRHN